MKAILAGLLAAAAMALAAEAAAQTLPFAPIIDAGKAGGLALSATLSSDRTFAEVIYSPSPGRESAGNSPGSGLRESSIKALVDRVCGGACAPGLGGGEGGSPSLPVPEAQTYGMLLAGLGLVAAMVRRGRRL